MSEHLFDPPERCVAGSVGPPGQRTFFIQVSGGGAMVTMSLEKQQVGLLGDSLDELLDEVAGPEADADAAQEFTDRAPLDTPFDDDFRVQRLSVAWEAGARRVILEAFDRPAEDEIAELTGGVDEADLPWAGMPLQHVRVFLEPARARAFAERCRESLKGGRRSCPFCSELLDPAGHICPRANGYRRDVP